MASGADELVQREDIDAVCIFAPADVHYEYGLRALRAGKHLFVEKPPAPTTEKLLILARLASERELIAAVGFNRRFQTGLREINGESILTAEAVFHKPNAGAPVPFGMKTWLAVSGIHALDLLCFVMGERPTALYAASNGAGAAENFSALIKWGERTATFSANNSAGARLERYIFHGYGVSYTAQK